MASGVVKKDDPDWVRTGQDKDAVLLRFYETSSYYDCIFSASVSHQEDEESCAKKFKCHRFVLAAASEVFEKLLYGNFKEANQGQDDEIKIEVSPTAFDLAMRFIYGNKCDFQSCELAIEVYYFAHKWMIESLLRAAGEFLIKQQGPEEALLVYEMCIDLNIDSETKLWKRCCSIIEEETSQVLSSKHWLAADKETIINIYLKTRLTVSETHLLDKLVLWGKARCSSDQSADLRAEIDPMLKNIRFRSMSCQEFSIIRKKCDVLTTEEKFKIMESLSLFDSNRMPPAFSHKGYPRNLSKSKKVNWSSVGRSSMNDGPDENGSTRFSFYVDQGGIFLDGIHLQSVDDAHINGMVISVTCSVHRSDSGMKLGTAKLDGVRRESLSLRGTEWWIAFDEPVALAKDFLYYIEIKYNSGQPSPTFFSYMHGDQKFQVCPGLCSVFFHPATKVRDAYAFQLCKC